VYYIHILKEVLVIAARAGHSSALLVPADACVINQSVYIYAYTRLTNLLQSLTGTVGTITTLKQAVNNASSWQQEKLEAAEQFSTMLEIKSFKRIQWSIFISFRCRKWLLVHNPSTNSISRLVAPSSYICIYVTRYVRQLFIAFTCYLKIVFKLIWLWGFQKAVVFSQIYKKHFLRGRT